MPPPELGSRSQPWFVRRRYGLGYRPLAWQGWVIAGVLVAAAIVVLAVVHASTARIVVVLALVAVYTAVGWRLSGERQDVGDAVEEAPAVAAREPLERLLGRRDNARPRAPDRRSARAAPREDPERLTERRATAPR
jgi:hypothetical protein